MKIKIRKGLGSFLYPLNMPYNERNLKEVESMTQTTLGKVLLYGGSVLLGIGLGLVISGLMWVG
jgi:hypothetical protein